MKPYAFAVLLGLILILAACGNETIENFSYSDQQGERVSLDTLKGTPWLATFIFTNCGTVCPPMIFNMGQIQEQLAAEGIEDYKIVAFSVDPKTDSPEKLKEYLGNFGVPDESKWHLLTGYSQEEIINFAKDNFKTFVKDDPTSEQIIHGTSFYLMDQEGAIVSNYDGFADVPIDQIQRDLEKLIK